MTKERLNFQNGSLSKKDWCDMDDFKHISVSYVRISPNLNSSFGEVVREALVIATKECRNVHFYFGEKEYWINVNDLLSSVNVVKG